MTILRISAIQHQPSRNRAVCWTQFSASYIVVCCTTVKTRTTLMTPVDCSHSTEWSKSCCRLSIRFLNFHFACSYVWFSKLYVICCRAVYRNEVGDSVGHLLPFDARCVFAAYFVQVLHWCLVRRTLRRICPFVPEDFSWFTAVLRKIWMDMLTHSTTWITTV